jgi:polysaccharide deacetylase family protein (PEP-CTERM system associated)
MTKLGSPITRQNILTIALEDYFQVGTLNNLIQRGQWYRFEPRLEQNTLRVLDLLDRFKIKATFFVVGWLAEEFGELIKAVADRGHEIASQGYFNRSIRQMSRHEFQEDILRAREVLEKVSQTKVLGYRVAHELFLPSDLWALEVLAQQGYVYDSSVSLLFRRYAHEPWRRFVHKVKFGEKQLWEFPLSSVNLFGWDLPIAGGNYFRQFPHALMKRGVEYWHRKYSAPYVMYFHVWEINPELPRVNTDSLISRIRHYRNLDKMERMLEYYFKQYSFTSVAHYLGMGTCLLETEGGSAKERLVEETVAEIQSGGDSSRTRPRKPSADTMPVLAKVPVTVVVPCYNEELVLPYLENTLKSVLKKLEGRYDLRFIFVDDGSTDGTHAYLENHLAHTFNGVILKNSQNLGVSASIMRGIRAAQTDIVCSIDCDCTYDPHELAAMIPLLTQGVDLVTASPYHPRGHVRNVPKWRLSVSRACSFFYRRLFKQKLFTYTSCFRVYRRSAVVHLDLKEQGFPGTAEMLARLDLQDSRIVEYPTTLEVRILGYSKMKIVKQVWRHLGIMTRILGKRLFQRGKTASIVEHKKSLTSQSPVHAADSMECRTRNGD